MLAGQTVCAELGKSDAPLGSDAEQPQHEGDHKHCDDDADEHPPFDGAEYASPHQPVESLDQSPAVKPIIVFSRTRARRSPPRRAPARKTASPTHGPNSAETTSVIRAVPISHPMIIGAPITTAACAWPSSPRDVPALSVSWTSSDLRGVQPTVPGVRPSRRVSCGPITSPLPRQERTSNDL